VIVSREVAAATPPSPETGCKPQPGAKEEEERQGEEEQEGEEERQGEEEECQGAAAAAAAALGEERERLYLLSPYLSFANTEARFAIFVLSSKQHEYKK